MTQYFASKLLIYCSRSLTFYKDMTLVHRDLIVKIGYTIRDLAGKVPVVWNIQ